MISSSKSPLLTPPFHKFYSTKHISSSTLKLNNKNNNKENNYNTKSISARQETDKMVISISSKSAPPVQLSNSNNNYSNVSVSCVGTTITPPSPPPLPPITADFEISRLNRLVSEFECLTEPIDRVKRLLDYAARLPPFPESARLPENRVTGCTTQVWLEARIDENGRMRFRGDSDSEITKGFISCLIWLLDGLEAEDVLAVKAADLAAMNVGIYGKAQSRINTWNNVLISMQNRTKSLTADCKRRTAKSQMDSLSTLLEVCHKLLDKENFLS
ncbi:sufE-like protein 2, chloroplastic [Mercurialis annua]|uniref:sufE-like protein 2, chloroplastic n=1 Tax=Mercurialis annua TaxID=3986 RepID=UPI002160A5D7|nr:sufE-like protein 2, chloroplastic [Mercurialis annua]